MINNNNDNKDNDNINTNNNDNKSQYEQRGKKSKDISYYILLLLLLLYPLIPLLFYIRFFMLQVKDQQSHSLHLILAYLIFVTTIFS